MNTKRLYVLCGWNGHDETVIGVFEDLQSAQVYGEVELTGERVYYDFEVYEHLAGTIGRGELVWEGGVNTGRIGGDG